MKKSAVIVAPGFEEGETLTIVDIIRRANLECDLVGFSKTVEGGHGITITCDKVLDDAITNYDMVILPGGYPGATNLLNNDELINNLQIMNNQNKYICAMCAAPIVLEKANLLVNKNYTAYVGYDKKIKQGNYLEDIVVKDGNIITSRGPATAYAFAYKLVDVLGGDSLTVKNRMVYFNAFDVKEEN
ncbi:MAG: DJ-1/PfpI family protein [Thomasclavelia sp.]|nr:DJ-1/PfpI family protein [Thomasclavelia sp.]